MHIECLTQILGVQAGEEGEEDSSSKAENGQEEQSRVNNTEKKVPVVLFDEAHKLSVSIIPTSRIYTSLTYTPTNPPINRPALINSTNAMKILLDSMLVLTKQDRLCHVIHATSDPFYQTWLRQLNVMQHCKVRPHRSPSFRITLTS